MSTHAPLTIDGSDANRNLVRLHLPGGSLEFGTGGDLLRRAQPVADIRRERQGYGRAAFAAAGPGDDANHGEEA